MDTDNSVMETWGGEKVQTIEGQWWWGGDICNYFQQ